MTSVPQNRVKNKHFGSLQRALSCMACQYSYYDAQWFVKCTALFQCQKFMEPFFRMTAWVIFRLLGVTLSVKMTVKLASSVRADLEIFENECLTARRPATELIEGESGARCTAGQRFLDNSSCPHAQALTTGSRASRECRPFTHRAVYWVNSTCRQKNKVIKQVW